MSKGNKNIADKLPKPACGRTTLIIGRDITRFLLPSKLKEKKRAGHSRLIIEREREREQQDRDGTSNTTISFQVFIILILFCPPNS
jgi:hypothetical protein